MKRSEHRILTTHTGSIQRPRELLEMHVMQQKGERVDPTKFNESVKRAVGGVVKSQAEAGISIINDGEMSRASYATYIKDRLTGFEGPENPRALYSATPDANEFPDWGERWIQTQKFAVSRPTCNGPVKAKDSTAVRRDIDNLKTAAAGIQYEELYM